MRTFKVQVEERTGHRYSVDVRAAKVSLTEQYLTFRDSQNNIVASFATWVYLKEVKRCEDCACA